MLVELTLQLFKPKQVQGKVNQTILLQKLNVIQKILMLEEITTIVPIIDLLQLQAENILFMDKLIVTLEQEMLQDLQLLFIKMVLM